MGKSTTPKWRWLSAGGLLAVVVGWIVQRIGLERYDNYYYSNTTPGLVLFWVGLLISLAGITALLVSLLKIARSATTSGGQVFAWILFGIVTFLVLVPIIAILALAGASA